MAKICRFLILQTELLYFFVKVSEYFLGIDFLAHLLLISDHLFDIFAVFLLRFIQIIHQSILK